MMECSPGPRENTIADEPASIVPGLQATENTGLCVCVEGSVYVLSIGLVTLDVICILLTFDLLMKRNFFTFSATIVLITVQTLTINK